MSLLKALFGKGKVATVRAYRPELADDAIDTPALRRDFDNPRHPMLRQAIAEVAAIAEADLRAHRRSPQFIAGLAALTAADAPALAADAALRLPLVRGRDDPRYRALEIMLEAVVERAEALALPWNPALPRPTFTGAQLIDIAWGLGGLLEFKFQVDGFHKLLKMFLHGLDTSGTTADPQVRAALTLLLQRVGEADISTRLRLAFAEALVERLGVPRSASPTLVAWDKDVAVRTARRDAVMAAAGPHLAPVVAIAFDTPRQLRGGPATVPAVQALLAAGPAALGDALVAMARIERDFRAPPCTHWGWLAQEQGKFNVEPREDGHHSVFDLVRAVILRKKILIGDAEMAALVAEVQAYPTYFTARGKPESNSYRSRAFLDQAVGVARRPEATATRAALLALLANAPTGRQFLLPAEWRDAIVAATGHDLGAAPALPLPAIDPGDYRAIDKLTAHFANIGDLRLHDPAHTGYLAGLVAAPDTLAPAAPDPRLRFQNDFERELRNAMQLKAAAQVVQAELAALQPLPAEAATALRDFGALCARLEGKAAPTAKWLAEARRLVAALPAGLALQQLRSLTANPIPDQPLRMAGQEYLRGLIFLSADWPAAQIGALLADYALAKCYQTVPGFGIRAERLGNACLWALIALPGGAGVPYLARMLTRVKYPKIRKKLDAALNEAAAAAGLSRGALDELSVPTHGLDGDGSITVSVGDGQAVIAIAGNRDVATRWVTADGKTVKSPGVAMKADKAGLAAAKALAGEIAADLGAQTVRLQRIYLEARDWPIAEWRARYLEQPLLRGLSQRLLWWLDAGGTRIAVLPRGDVLTDVDGNIIAAADARIALWHPIDDDPAQVLRWRDRIEALAIVQPFAQVWREIYRLTDAEIATGTYSNRWAGHILKQHQFMTLARLNGWTVTHRMWVDAPNDAPAHIVVPAHGLVADYWVEGAGGDDPEVLDSQAYVYVASDRLAFSRIAADAGDSAYGPARSGAVAMADVPPIIVSEIMRHCDLFTAVASIASDPLWRDRGRGARHPTSWDHVALQYWDRQSFGDMTEAAKIRRALLERIVPKLAIADRCRFDEESLLVEGTRHAYRIHIGSAAIQIMPAKQHLCIVPAGSPERDFYVPFEGDRTLSLIISKAVLLAADDKITDPVILRQLG